MLRPLLENESLVIIKNKEWYIPDGKVDAPKTTNQWQALVNRSTQLKKIGLRAFCMMDCFFENGFSTELVNYECNLPSGLQIPFIPICVYRQIDLDCLAEKDKKKLIECHNQYDISIFVSNIVVGHKIILVYTLLDNDIC